MWRDLLSVMTFQAGYNSSLVLFSTFVLGAACGLIGSFIYLRKRALLSDAISHSTLPGIALGFLAALALGLNDGRHLPTLMAGAALMALLGGLCVQWIKTYTRLNEDVAIGSVLSVFYGGGVVLLSIIQRLQAGSKAGLETFLLGQVSGLTANESIIIIVTCAIVAAAAVLLFKEFTLLCFDFSYAQTSGQPHTKLDLALLALMIVIVCVGLKTVGLVLIVALLVIPPVTARFWTDNMPRLVFLASVFGALSCYIGGALSATLPDLPTGATIVLTAFAFFAAGFLFSLCRARHAAA